MSVSRRGLLGASAGLAAPSLAGARPTRSVELLVGAQPGSPPDLWARGVAPFLERHLPRLSVAVRNGPGRSGLDAVAQLAATPPESKTLGVLTSPTLLVRAIEAGEPSPVTLIHPLAALVEEPVVVVTGSLGPDDFAALRALGDRGLIGTPPSGSAAHVAALRFDGRLDLPRLAFPSASAARQAALSGNVAAAVLGMAEAISSLREGRLRALGIAASRRSSLFPEVPTLRESGVDVVAVTFRGFAVSREAPAAWRTSALAALEAVASDPDFVTQCGDRGQASRLIGPDAWENLLGRVDAELRQRWREDPWLPRRS